MTALTSDLTQAKLSLWPCSLHITSWHCTGWPQSERRFDLGMQRRSNLRVKSEWGCSGYSCCLLKQDPTTPLQVLQICTKGPRVPCQLCLHKGMGVVEAGGSEGLGEIKGTWPEAASEQSKGNKHGPLHRQCIRESLELCLQSTGTEGQHRSYLLQDSSLLQESQFRKRGKHTRQGNREPQAQAHSFCSKNMPRPYPQ